MFNDRAWEAPRSTIICRGTVAPSASRAVISTKGKSRFEAERDRASLALVVEISRLGQGDDHAVVVDGHHETAEQGVADDAAGFQVQIDQVPDRPGPSGLS